MKFLLSYVAILFCFTSGQAQTFEWVRGGGSTDIISAGTRLEAVYSMCTDYNGNVYTLSALGTSAPIIADTFNRPGGAYGNNQNILFTSHTCNGQMRFAKLISGGGSISYGLAADMTGHIYIAMHSFHGTTPGTLLRIGYDTTITGVTNQTQMLIQYDTSGHFEWIRFVGNNTIATILGALSYGSGVAMDGNNNVHFINTMKFGVPITPSLTSHWGTYDLKYDVSGNLLSVKKLQIDSSLIAVDGVCIDKQTNKLYVIGSRQYAMFPDSSRYPYVAAYDTSRNLEWIDTLASPWPSASFPTFSGITSDNAGHLYLTGGAPDAVGYQSDTIYQELPGTLSFVMKIDSDSHVGWIRGFSATLSANGLWHPALTPNGNVAAAGGFVGTFKSGPHTLVGYAGEGQSSAFVVLDTAGYIDTLHQLHGVGFYDKANCVVSDRTGNLYIGGQAANNVWAGSLTAYTGIGGNSDYYVMKYGGDCDCIAMPTAYYTDTGTIVRGFTYTGTTTDVDSVKWDFGDGTGSSLLNPIHTYLTADTFFACVRVYTPCGSDLYCKEIRIPCLSAPVPAFAMSGTGLTRTFTYTGTTTGVTGPVSWTFTDGGTASGSPVAHTFSAAATYTACVTAVNPCGIVTTCNPIVVTCISSPVSAFIAGGVGLTRTFTYTGTTAGLDSVTWTFGDGGTDAGLTPTHTFSAAGTYTICAKVYTNCGTHTFCSAVIVTCITPPTAAYTLAGTDLSRTFTYTGTSTGMDSVTWNFGDGTTSTSTVLSPSHTFSAAGTYTVCVTVYTNCGSHTFCSPVTLICTVPPIAAFTISGTGATRTFTYTGTVAGMDSVRWDFGDGGTSTVLSPSHTYLTEGSFSICVRIYTNCGNHTSCQTVIVNCFIPVTAAYTDTGNLVHGYAYTGTMTGYDSVVWDYGDGSVDTGLVTLHTYAAAGTYHVCAKVYTNCGTHTFCRDIIVSATSAVPSVSMAGIKVYPNPSSGELYITGVRQSTDYRLLNVVGAVLQEGKLNTGNNTIAIQQMPPGILVLEMNGADGSKNVIRVVKR